MVHGRFAGRRLTLEELVALNDELAALVRAGVPLDETLGLAGADLPGRLGTLAARLSSALESGDNLAGVLERDASVPRAYAAVVRIGIRTGRLASALESISVSARRLLEMRRRTFLAMLYPVMVLILAYAMFAFTVLYLSPEMMDAWMRLNDYSLRQMQAVGPVMQSASRWVIAVPAIAVIASAFGLWFRNRLRGGSRLTQAQRAAVLSEMVALLVASDVPLDEAIELAADATGDNEVSSMGRRVAERLRQGSAAELREAGLPRLLMWLIETHGSRRDFSKALRRTAEIYRARVNRLADWYAVTLPAWFTVGVGGTAVALYAAYALVPWLTVIYRFVSGV